MLKKISSEIKQINIFSPKDWLNLFNKYRLTHFLITGGSGVIINMLFTIFFAELVFVKEKLYYIPILSTFFITKGYFIATLIGLSINLIYNFTLHTIFTFKTKTKHKSRFTIFIIYSILMTLIQAKIINIIIEIIGEDFYIIVIPAIIAIFSILTYFVFKIWLFKEK